MQLILTVIENLNLNNFKSEKSSLDFKMFKACFAHFHLMTFISSH